MVVSKPAALVVSCLAVLVMASVASPVAAEDLSPVLMLHLGDVQKRRSCQKGLLPCEEAVIEGEVSEDGYFVYLLAARADTTRGYAGVQLGIHYDGETESGVDVLDWQKCASLEFPSTGWPGAAVEPP